MPSSSPYRSDAQVYCEALVREADRDRFLAGLFAPAECRPDLFALYAFNVEIGRVRDVARDPMPGEVRLQWWRDALAGQGYGSVAGHPVVAALLDTIVRHALPLQPLIDLIDAHSFDLYDDPMATTADLDSYARAASSSLFALAGRVLGAEGDAVARAAETGGIAYALVGLLREFPRHAARRQLYLPRDLLERHRVAADDIFARHPGPALAAALAELRATASARLTQCRHALVDVPPQAGPAFLPLALLKPRLRCLARGEENPFVPAEVPQWRRQWTLWRASRRRNPLD